MIKEDYVNFETAKLLNEKGFWNSKIERRYILNDVSVYRWICGNSYKEFKSGELVTYRDQEFLYHEIIENSIEAPTLQMAMKWLREKHNLHIGPYSKGLQGWSFQIFNLGKGDMFGCKPTYTEILSDNFTRTYEEACEEAIIYCLKNLM